LIQNIHLTIQTNTDIVVTHLLYNYSANIYDLLLG